MTEAFWLYLVFNWPVCQTHGCMFQQAKFLRGFPPLAATMVYELENKQGYIN